MAGQVLTEVSHLFRFRCRSAWRVVRDVHRGRLVSRYTGTGTEGRAGTGGRWSHTVGWVSLSGRGSGVKCANIIAGAGFFAVLPRRCTHRSQAGYCAPSCQSFRNVSLHMHQLHNRIAVDVSQVALGLFPELVLCAFADGKHDDKPGRNFWRLREQSEGTRRQTAQ